MRLEYTVAYSSLQQRDSEVEVIPSEFIVSVSDEHAL